MEFLLITAYCAKMNLKSVLETYKNIGLNVTGIDAKEKFYTALKDKTDPEEKRKTIGKLFIDVFQDEAQK